MKLPKFGQPQNQNPYALPQPAASKKKLFLMAGGALLLLLVVGYLSFGGRSTPSQTSYRSGMQNTADALGIVDAYQKDLQFDKAKNNISLIQILLRGNYQTLNDLYKDTYKVKKRFPASPKPDKDSAELLDSAQRANQLDSEIIEVLQPKVTAALSSFKTAEVGFTKKSSLDTINTAQNDLQKIKDILNQPL